MGSLLLARDGKGDQFEDREVKSIDLEFGELVDTPWEQRMIGKC